MAEIENKPVEKIDRRKIKKIKDIVEEHPVEKMINEEI